jgi:hypothetical protein
MQTKRIATALFAFALLVGFAVAVQAADTTPKPDSGAKSCCHPADAAGATGAHCDRPAQGGDKACCQEHAKQGKAGDCCCCDEACDHAAAEKKEPAPKS